MKVSEILLDERLNDKTTVVIKGPSGRPIAFGRWYQDKILSWCNFDATFEFVEERNRFYLQLL